MSFQAELKDYKENKSIDAEDCLLLVYDKKHFESRNGDGVPYRVFQR